MSAKTVATLYTHASANHSTQTVTTMDSLTTKYCGNCGYIIDTTNQPWTYMRERLVMVYYHYDSTGCATASSNKPVKIYPDRRTHGRKEE